MKDILYILTLPAIFLAFSPQQFRIVNRRSSIGLSPWFCLLGCLSTLSSFFNVVILQWPIIQTCRADTCLADLIGFFQITALAISFLLTFTLFLIYYPRPWVQSHSEDDEGNAVHQVFGIFLVFTVCSTLLVVLVATVHGIESKVGIGLAWAFGVLCSFFSLIQYVPQIWHTWTRKNIGALSMVTLCIQAPGSFFFTYVLATSPKTDPSTWMGFFLSGMFQIFLLSICLYVKLSGEVRDEEEGGENESLLPDGRVRA